MKSNSEDMEWLRIKWRNVDIDMKGLRDNAVPENIMNSRVVGLRGSLMRRYSAMAFFCCLCPLWIFSAVRLGFPVWFNVAYGCFFLVMAALSLVQRRIVSKLDIIGMPVNELLQIVYRIQLVRRRCKWIGCMLALPLLVWLFMLIYSTGSVAMIVGAWSGAVVGVAIGLWLDYRMRRLIRDLRDAIGA